MDPSIPAAFDKGAQLPGSADLGNALSPDRSPEDTAGDPIRRKPMRLSLACNQCRKRKVRCDARLPKCGNCTVRNETCETTDLRKPSNGPTIRSRALPEGRGRRSRRKSEPRPAQHPGNWMGPGASPASMDLNGSISTDVGEDTPRQTSGRCGCSASGSGASLPLQNSRTDEEEAISWVSRGYRLSMTAQNSQVALQGHASGVSPDAVVNTDDTPYRVKFVGGTSVQCLSAFIDLHLGTQGLPPVGPLFRHGMRHSEEFPVPLEHEFPALPSREILYIHLDTFVTNIWPLFPAVDRVDLETYIDRLLAVQDEEPIGLKGKIAVRDVPSLAMIYIIACIGIDEKSGCASEESTRYLRACYGLSSHLTGMSYLTSVQALLLLALALHGQARDGQAWHVVGQAIRVAQSLGLHKLHVQRPGNDNSVNAPRGYQANYDLHRRLWWSCFSLEKLLQLECGRPSCTRNGDFDRMLPSYTTSVSSEDGPPDYFAAWVSLAGIMGRISDRLYSRNFPDSEELFLETCRLDQALLDWDRCLPESLRPGGEGLGYLDEGSHSVLSSFLSQQYFSAQITVLRISLTFPHQSFIAEVKKRSAALPPTSRLLRASALCASAARTIAFQTLQLADRRIRSTVLSASQPFLAAVVIALGVLREPETRLARADIELLNSVTEHVEDFYVRWGQDAAFVRIFAELRDRIMSVSREGSGRGTHGLDTRIDARGMGSACGGAGQMAQQGAVSEVSMGLDAIVDFDMDIFGGRELWNLVEADFSGWASGN
ncbi:uncharacterized protein DNG_04096 [Cephalotrichum gorgonifer]|uniref:Zn(2)-C6 fungal-type domain-containing protein n=1 Tax=Cephalotrichum gorgonifer TaxID=2041049 RepID=A0AAE8SUK7_9PEZI|nr:uncharacterized protein DNG_04096 [Cephalotrichum gorgonifer]